MNESFINALLSDLERLFPKDTFNILTHPIRNELQADYIVNLGSYYVCKLRFNEDSIEIVADILKLEGLPTIFNYNDPKEFCGMRKIYELICETAAKNHAYSEFVLNGGRHFLHHIKLGKDILMASKVA